MADSFFTGPESFTLIFNSDADNVIHNFDDSFSVILTKNFEFTGTWEMGILQFIIKPPLMLAKSKLYVSSPDKIDEENFEKSINLKNTSLTSPENLIDIINESIPKSMKSYINFSIDQNGFVDMRIQNTKVKIESDMLSDVWV